MLGRATLTSTLRLALALALCGGAGRIALAAPSPPRTRAASPASPAGPAPGKRKPSAYGATKHGSPTSGVFRDTRHARGSCLQCHGGPAQRAKQRGERFPRALFAAPGRDLCFECHNRPSGSYPGPSAYRNSSHGNSAPPTVDDRRPKASARAVYETGGCSACHDPHGVTDAAGLIPGMLIARGDALCLRCHGPSGPGPTVAEELAKPYTHPSPDRPGSLGTGASGAPPAGCTDCHNPHLVGRDPSLLLAPAASRRITGVPRVRVTNLPGSPPLLESLAADDGSPPREYEICLRCHSGTQVGAPVPWSATPTFPGMPALPGAPNASGAAGARSTVTSIASLVNPGNPSYHPVEALGKNLAIPAAAFTSRWSADRLVYCSDCHSGDALRGPHGSSFPKLIKKRHLISVRPDKAQETDLCFDCHSYATYAQIGAGAAAAATRFDRHAAHSARGYGCWSCHDAHGSLTLPFLLVTRTPGIASYTLTPGGGTCTTTCHTASPRTATYLAAYPR